VWWPPFPGADLVRGSLEWTADFSPLEASHLNVTGCPLLYVLHLDCPGLASLSTFLQECLETTQDYRHSAPSTERCNCSLVRSRTSNLHGVGGVALGLLHPRTALRAIGQPQPALDPLQLRDDRIEAHLQGGQLQKDARYDLPVHNV